MKTRTLLRCFLLCASVILALLGTGIALASNAADGGSQNWPHFGYDDSYTSYNPSVANGIVYFLSTRLCTLSTRRPK